MLAMKTFFTTYKTLFILFAYLGGASALFYGLTERNPMPFLMGLFFITFSFFKVIHLTKFVASFKRYDLFARHLPFYAWLYPFIEIILGVLFLSNTWLMEASMITIIVLTATNIGVAQRLRQGAVIECACLGVVFGLPLSNVTLLENTVMIIMGVMQLWP